jgi:hypothetical protein
MQRCLSSGMGKLSERHYSMKVLFAIEPKGVALSLFGVVLWLFAQ